MSGNIGDGRPVRFCPECKQADDHPRHVIAGEDPSIARHLDCCRNVGCPDGTCNVATAGAEDKRGGELVEHLLGLVNDDVVERLAAHRAENPHQDPAHPSFAGWPATVNQHGPVRLQGADR